MLDNVTIGPMDVLKIPKQQAQEEAMTLLENESASVLSSGIRQRKHAMTITT